MVALFAGAAYAAVVTIQGTPITIKKLISDDDEINGRSEDEIHEYSYDVARAGVAIATGTGF